MLNSDSMPVAANPMTTVTAPTTMRKGAGLRVTNLPSSSAARSTPGSACATGRGGPSEPRDSRRLSMMARPAGISVIITRKLIPTPMPAIIPKSPTIPIGENKLARRLTIVVTAASATGTDTFRSPVRTAAATESPAFRRSR